MKITMLLHGGWRNPHAGAVRPILSWAKGISGHEVSVAMMNAGERLEGHARRSGIGYCNFKTTGSLLRHIESDGPDIILGDDSMPVLKTCSAITRRTGTPISTYAQLLLGTQSIVEPIDSSGASAIKRVRHALSRLVPFSAFRTAYKRMLGKDHSVICNSRSTATLLQVLYGIEPEGVVYPPLDEAVFRERKKAAREGALLYLGSFGLDSDPAFLRQIIRALHDAGEDVTIFGNRELGLALAREGSRQGAGAVRFLDGCTDEELAAEYSSAALTICPQKWELFGYVVAESISCGTPVLAFNCMGPGEILSEYGGGVLVDRKDDFIGALKDIGAAAGIAPKIDLDGAGFRLRQSSAAITATLEKACARKKVQAQRG